MTKQQSQVMQESRVIKRISNKRIRNGKVQYYVKWKGNHNQPGAWIPISQLSQYHKKIADFQQNIWKDKKREQIRKRLSFIKLLQQKETYDKKRMSIKPLKHKLNQIEIIQSESISSQEQYQQIKQLKQVKAQEDIQKIKVARFDCISGIWRNADYSLEELTEINEVRNRHAAEYQAKDVIIKEIVKIKGQLVVHYQMQSRKYQCLLKNFQLFLPQLLITYLLSQYNPAQHILLKPESDEVSQSQSSQNQDDEDQEDSS